MNHIFACRVLFLVAVTEQALAYSECEGKVAQVFTDTQTCVVLQGNVTSGCTAGNEGNATRVHSAALAAMLAGKPVVLRFGNNGVGCSGGGLRGDLAGIWVRN